MTRYAFGDFVLDTGRIEISGPDGERSFEPQVFDVLRVLIEADGRLVTKEALLDEVWGDRFISESALTTRIKQARQLVDDNGRRQWAIKTVHGKGYRFVADFTIDEAPTRSATAAASPAQLTGLSERLGLPRELEPEVRQVVVGRDEESTRALAVLESPGRRPTSWIWLLGEPGIGKTHLAAHIAHAAHEGGAHVLFGRCNEDLAVPYQPIIEALRGATLHLNGDDLREALGPLGNELVRLLPDLASRVPGLVQPNHSDTDTGRYRLFEAVMGWLHVVSAARPVVVVVDDAHWATDSTLQLLDHINRSPLATQATIIVTARDTAPDENAYLADLVAKGQGAANQAVIRLGGLDADATRQLLDHDSPQAHEAVDVDAVLNQTAGNPLLIRALGRDGQAAVDLASAVRRRLASLEPQVQQTLTVASIVGLEFDLKVVAHAAGRDDLDVLDDLEEAVAARLLVDVGADRFRFVHALVRASLREDVTSGRRARWHARIGAAIEATLVSANNRHSIVLAHHYAEASQSDQALRPTAIDHLRNAAQQASAQLSFADAVAHLQTARTLTDDDQPLLRAELAIAQGDAEKDAGRSLMALRSFEDAFRDAQQAQDSGLVADAALRYEDASWRPGRFGGPAVERLETAEAMVDENDKNTRARIQIALTRAHALSGDIEGSRAAWHEAELLIDEVGDTWLEVHGLNAFLSTMQHQEWGSDPTLGRVARLAELIDQVDDLEESILARQIQLFYLARCGEMASYRRVHEQIRVATAELHSSFWDYIHANHDAMLSMYEGDLVAAEQAAEACMTIAEGLVDEDNSGTYGLRMFTIRREQQRLARLVPMIRHLADTNDAGSFWTPGLALLLVETSNADHAAELFNEFAAADFEIPGDAMWTTVMTMFIEVAVALGEVDACRLLYDRFRAQSGLLVVTGHGIICFGSSDRYLGMLALTFGDLELAEAHLLKAIDADEGGGSPLWAGHARVWLARVRRSQGRDDEVVALATAAASVAADGGYSALESSAHEILLANRL